MTYQLTTATFASFAQDSAVRHIPAWFYVQDQDEGVVSFVGSSRIRDGAAHPLRYGSDRTHQLIVGELLVRPHYVVATDRLRGQGLGGLATQTHDLRRFLEAGEILLDPHGLCAATSY